MDYCSVQIKWLEIDQSRKRKVYYKRSIAVYWYIIVPYYLCNFYFSYIQHRYTIASDYYAFMNTVQFSLVIVVVEYTDTFVSCILESIASLGKKVRIWSNTSVRLVCFGLLQSVKCLRMVHGQTAEPSNRVFGTIVDYVEIWYLSVRTC